MAKSMPFQYEFGGPVGTLVTTMALPVVILLLAHWADVGAVDLNVLNDLRQGGWQQLRASPVLCPSCDQTDLLWKCTAGLLAWFGFQVILERFLPAELVQGTVIPATGQRLVYRINGHLAFWVTLFIVVGGWPYWNDELGMIQFTSAPLHLLYDYYAELALCIIQLCLGLSTYLYLNSFVGDKVLANGGNSGNPVYDFFMGRELNPRIGGFDWKEFCELRPGLMGWLLLNIASARQQQVELGYVSWSMILLILFQGNYVWDALYQEKAILTTMDITTDGFGYMLVLGDLAWVPFTYSLQARYLVKHDPHLSPVALGAIVALHMLGYYIFRAANGQKDAFRRDPTHPQVSHLQFLSTKRGTKLLTSGWWGLARKINYTGDWLMGLTWCLLCGVDSIVPYYYAIYFGILLVHRSMRDDHLCAGKYGEDWETYKKLVPYRFVPGVV